MPIDYAALKTELQNDPAALGYAALITAGNDQGLADALNLVRNGVPYQINREPIATALFITKMDSAEFAALTQPQLLRLNTMLIGGAVDINDANTQTSLLGIFPANGASKAAVQALLKRQGSRAEVLFGRGVVVTATDVEYARKRA